MTFYWLAIRPGCLSSISIPETKRDSSSPDRPTPWETWSARSACCFEIEHPLAAPIPAGTRWLVDSQPSVVREFGPRKIREDQRTFNDGIFDDVVHRGCEKTQDVFASPHQLPYSDFKTRIGEKKYQSVTADHEWVVRMSDGGDDFSRTIHRIDIHHVT